MKVAIAVCVRVCVRVPHGYSGSCQLFSPPTPPQGLICPECKIWQKVVTLSPPPQSSSRGSMTDLQRNLLVLFVAETFSQLICQQQLLSVSRCAEY